VCRFAGERFRMGLVNLRDGKKKARWLRASNYFLGGE
jgi:hypothetical protein